MLEKSKPTGERPIFEIRAWNGEPRGKEGLRNPERVIEIYENGFVKGLEDYDKVYIVNRIAPYIVLLKAQIKKLEESDGD